MKGYGLPTFVESRARVLRRRCLFGLWFVAVFVAAAWLPVYVLVTP